MTTSSEMVLIGGIVKELEAAGSWCGETHIQKTAYLAKICRDVPLDSEFVLYKHGPYSFDLSTSLSHMRMRALAVTSPNSGYGPSFSLNQGLWSALNRASGHLFDRYEAVVRDLCGVLGRKNVAELERLATAVYVANTFPSIGQEAMPTKLVELKPHVTREQAEAAFDEARRKRLIG